ncbi:hypothetical protein PENSOL_c018G07101 [Penicillium solitum]|uniref:BZIP domain-containing protein n=1 Tax=Penicillium solitum TaxID=60172 RepID=A0A1V6R357_9EURO|nr:uncharacterized protein PENSOL_c018G07101 [Penicillium solitum]OQD95910.1 hypothetical protein PENSOL_c018G07101 [Penicillium solitum]
MPTVQVKKSSLGRPRKSAEDAKSTRRAQVREAQQAYRSRQQSQLSSLKARVVQLEDAFHHLSQTMHTFDDQVIRNGSQLSQPELFQTVQSLRDDIVSHLKQADIRFQESPNNEPSEPSQAVVGQARAQVASEVPTGSLKDHTLESDFWKLFLGSSAGMIPSTNTQALDNQSNDLNPIPVTPSIAETHTIQYATTPFTQRLYRACAQSGYRFLSNPSYKDEDMWKFGLLLQRMPRADITDYFARVVNLEPCNPIIDARFPYISLGGAGKHYLQPSSDYFSHSFALFRATNGVTHVPADEDWFDVHDVERYLLNQGIGVGEFPSPTLTISYPSSSVAGHSDLEAPQGELHDGMTMVIDEYKLINRLSQLPVSLGCVAGFRRSDVERVISYNVRWMSVGATGSPG